MMKKMICFASIAALLAIGIAISQEAGEKKPTADRHKDRGVTCTSCHEGEAEPKTAAPPQSCLTCKNHGSWDTVTERINNNKEYRINPHRNHIITANLEEFECTMCHHAHEDDYVFCQNCHQGIAFK